MKLTTEKIKNRLNKIKFVIAIISGKGGVGKSTVCAQLALSLVLKGHKVGVLDIDLCGPSIPKIFGVKNDKMYAHEGGIVPVQVDERGLFCVSISFVLKNRDSPIILRGPRKHTVLKEFLEKICWGELDFLIIDTPPGTSDEHISIFQLLPACEVIIVTQPQKISLKDVRKEVSFCKIMKIPILGVIENMSGFKCPCCDEITYIFSKDGGRKLAETYDLNFLCSLPLDPALTKSEDEEKNFVESFQESIVAKELAKVADMLKTKLPPEEVKKEEEEEGEEEDSEAAKKFRMCCQSCTCGKKN